MYDLGKIVVGLLIFLLLITAPVWLNAARGGDVTLPEPELPEGYERCVDDVSVMRTDHMIMLDDWRDLVIRDADRIYTTADGRSYYRSLTGTCLGCHEDKGRFCDRCHDSVGVAPYCWDCHVAPGEENK